MKKWIGYLFLVIFLIFTLPVKQIGESLLKKNTNEQVDGSDANTNETAKQQQQMQEEVLHKCILPYYAACSGALDINLAADEMFLADCRLIPHFVPDIATPPPNRA